jgi:S1-C subfamily serine protease
MEPSTSYRPRVSRETRLLLTAGALAIAALWLLARFRFQDQPVTPNPIPAVLTQLTNTPKYDDLAAEVARAQPRLEGVLVPVDTVPAGAPRRIAGLRFRDDEVVTFLSDGSMVDAASLRAWDPASGLAVVSVASQPNVLPVVWTPRRLELPRYLVVGEEVSSTGVSLRPMFVGSLRPAATALWSEAIWILPPDSDLRPGAFLFTTGDTELVGMVIAHRGERAIVPGATLLVEANRLRERPRTAAGTLGIEVQALTNPVALVTGAEVGVVVTFVRPDGPAAGRLMAGDVIEEVDGRPLATREAWDVRMRRLSVDEAMTVRVRRRGEVLDIALVAVSPPVPVVTRSLGLTLRRRAGIGAEVIRVEPASAGNRAGLVAGDVVTLIEDVQAPTPAQVTRSFAALREGQRSMVAVTRGATHFVTTLER